MATYDRNYGKSAFSKKDQSKQDMSEMEMVMQNSSLAHEYARLQLETMDSTYQQEQILEQLDGYKKTYFSARKLLEIYDPERLKEVEKCLLEEKKEVFTYYSA